MLDERASNPIFGFCSQRPLDHIISWACTRALEKADGFICCARIIQLDTKTQSFINYVPRQNITIASIYTALDILQSEIGVISTEERLSDTIKPTILYRAVMPLDTRYGPIDLQLDLVKITNYEEVVL